MRHKTFFSAYTWICCAQAYAMILWLELQLLMEYELEMKSIGDDDDMEKTAVYFCGTLNWSEDCLGVQPDRTCALIVARAGYGNVSEWVHPADWSDCRWVLNLPRYIELQWHGLCTWPKTEWIWEWTRKTMASPREGDNERLKRDARYLHDHLTNTVFFSTVAYWATCHSGCTVMLGNHLIAAWSQVQPRIGIELWWGRTVFWFAVNLWNFGVCAHDAWVSHRVDACACRAIMLKRGCGGLKHIRRIFVGIQCGRIEAPDRVEWFPKTEAWIGIEMLPE